jgi:hypothetical protein
LVLAASCVWCGGTLAGPTADPLPAPNPIPGTLVIVGGGRTPPAILREFVERAGGKQAKLVVIPTASAEADRPIRQSRSWSSGEHTSLPRCNCCTRATASKRTIRPSVPR